MKVDSYACDSCKNPKGTLNHWFKFTGHPDQFSVTDWAGSDYTNTLHLCSDSCVVKTVQGWLSSQKELSQNGE
jgi:hypothetical protein